MFYFGGHWEQPSLPRWELAPSAKIPRSRKIHAIGIIFAGMFALGIALISTVRSYAVDLSHFLFGDVLSVSTHSLWLILIFGGLVLLTIFAFYKEFTTLSFDPILAATLRLPVGLLNNLLLTLIAVTVAVSLQTVGVALMVAMLVTPAATAYLLTHRLSTMMLLARGLCFVIGSDRFISLVLSKHRIRRGDRVDCDVVLYDCVCVEEDKNGITCASFSIFSIEREWI